MSDVDDDAGEWSDYEGDDECLEDDLDAAEDVLDSDQESELDYTASIPEAGHMNQQVVSLQQNCLECVVNNFERFNQAFISSGDPALLWNLKFLQRVYTSDIIKGLNLKGMLSDRHIDFIINESLKELDIGIFIDNKCSLKTIQERMAQVGHSFKKVLLESPYCCYMEENISEFLSETVCHLKNVEVIDIPQNCNDAILKNISMFCTKLKELYIDYSSDVTEAGLELLCKDRDTECLIQVLSIKDVKVSDRATIKFLLKNMPYLEVLEYIFLPSKLYSIHEEDLKNNTLKTAKKYNLTKLLCYFDTKLELFLKVCTEVCPNIKTLEVNILSEKALDLISHFSNLEDLTIATLLYDPREPRIDINNFLKSNGSHLKHLKIHHFSFSVSNLIKSCPKLESLALSAVTFPKHTTEGLSSNAKLSSLHELCCLKDITFSGQYAEDSVTDILLSSPDLEQLSFKECMFLFENFEINTKLAKYCENCALQSLRFNNCNIKLALLKSIILTCSSLTYLAIESCENISYNDVSYLQMLRNTGSGFINIVFEEYYVYTYDYSDD